MVTLQKTEVKITPNMSQNNFQRQCKSLQKRMKITPKKSDNHSKKVNVTHLESSPKDRSFVLSCSSFGVILHLFGVIFTCFRMIFTNFVSEFHSVKVVFTFLKSYHFTFIHETIVSAYTLREYCNFFTEGY